MFYAISGSEKLILRALLKHCHQASSQPLTNVLRKSGRGGGGQVVRALAFDSGDPR